MAHFTSLIVITFVRYFLDLEMNKYEISGDTVNGCGILYMYKIGAIAR